MVWNHDIAHQSDLKRFLIKMIQNSLSIIHLQNQHIAHKRWSSKNTSKNCKVEKLNSQFWTPGTSGVDAFVYDWSSDNNWLVPPVHCIPNVLKHMLFYKCVGTLVVPKWKSALFWPWWNHDIAHQSDLKRFLIKMIQNSLSTIHLPNQRIAYERWSSKNT
jgi:hypothetical protein